MAFKVDDIVEYKIVKSGGPGKKPIVRWQKARVTQAPSGGMISLRTSAGGWACVQVERVRKCHKK